MEARLLATAVVMVLLLAAMAIYGHRTRKVERARLTERDKKLEKLSQAVSANGHQRGKVLELRKQ